MAFLHNHGTLQGTSCNYNFKSAWIAFDLLHSCLMSACCILKDYHAVVQVPCETFKDLGRPPEKAQPRVRLEAIETVRDFVWEINTSMANVNFTMTFGWISGHPEYHGDQSFSRRRLLQEPAGSGRNTSPLQLSVAYGFPAVRS